MNKEKRSALVKKFATLTNYPLDDLIHDMKASEASDINNAGLEKQISYLLDCYVGEEDKAEDYLRDLLGWITHE